MALLPADGIPVMNSGAAGSAGSTVARLQRSIGGELDRLHSSIDATQRLGGAAAGSKLTELEGKVTELERMLSSRHLRTVATAHQNVANDNGVIALLLICYNRPEYLQRALDVLMKYAPTNLQSTKWVFVISQDGNHQGVSKVASRFVASVKEKYPQFGAHHIKHKQSAGNGYKVCAALWLLLCLLHPIRFASFTIGSSAKTLETKHAFWVGVGKGVW
jgi:hypothetical protein